MSHKATKWLADVRANSLGHSEFRVLFHLCDCHTPDRGCFPTQAYLKDAAAVSNGTLNNVLNSMEGKGLLVRQRRWDDSKGRQAPTRYFLGFEFDEPDAIVARRDLTPKIGDRAVSSSDPNLSPAETPTCLQPTGEVTSNINKDTNCARDATLRGWADLIKAKKAWVAPHITPGQAQEMIGAGMVSEEECRRVGVRF